MERGDTSNSDQYALDAIRVAAMRVRRLFMAIQFLALFLGAVLFGSWQHNWTFLRATTARYGLLLFEVDKPETIPNVPILDKKTREEHSSSWVAQWLSRDNLRVHPRVYDQQLLMQGANLVIYKGFSKVELQEYISSLDHVFSDEVLRVSVPLTNVRMDVNGLGLLGGTLSFTLLAWLYFCLQGERTGLYQLTEKSPAVMELGELVFASTSTGRVGRWLSRIVFVWGILVVVVLDAIIFAGDWRTRHVGAMVSPTITTATLAFEIVLLAMNFFWVVVSTREIYMITRKLRLLSTGLRPQP